MAVSKSAVFLILLLNSWSNAEESAQTDNSDNDSVEDAAQERGKRQQMILVPANQILQNQDALATFLSLLRGQPVQSSQQIAVLPTSNGQFVLAQAPQQQQQQQQQRPSYGSNNNNQQQQQQTAFAIAAPPMIQVAPQPVIIPAASRQFVLATGQDNAAMGCLKNEDCINTYAPARLNCCSAQWRYNRNDETRIAVLKSQDEIQAGNTGCNCGRNNFCVIEARLPHQLYFSEDYCQPNRAQCSGYICGFSSKKKA